ncbi:MAG: LysM peptidoglycan-binding domain-containing protein [Bacteroidia bacterium]|nr:LysM peptidoglycan-binding domain-containing protein [Bacteroidia bacterium]
MYHTVRPGECLSVIARRYRVSVGYLCRLNGLSPRSVLRVGQRLRIR